MGILSYDIFDVVLEGTQPLGAYVEVTMYFCYYFITHGCDHPSLCHCLLHMRSTSHMDSWVSIFGSLLHLVGMHAFDSFDGMYLDRNSGI